MLAGHTGELHYGSSKLPRRYNLLPFQYERILQLHPASNYLLKTYLGIKAVASSLLTLVRR